MQWKKGFTMIELLVVLIILGILVAVAAPMYFANVNRARASEAVAAMGVIRQALRDYRTSHSSFPPADIADITLAVSSTTTAGGAGVNVGVTQYFSNSAYTVTLAGTPAWTGTVPATPNAVGFVIHANGATTNPCAASGVVTNCALKGNEVRTGTGTTTDPVTDSFKLQMDDTGRVLVAYTGTIYSEW